MSASYPRLSGPFGAAHPAVLDRRIRELMLAAVALVVPLAIALALSLEVPHPNLLLVLGLLIGAAGTVALVIVSRLEVTVTIVALYLGLVDGPLKLSIGGGEATAVIRNVLIFAVCLGAVLRLLGAKERVKLPPLSGWVIALVVLVAVYAFNPKTGGVLKVLGGGRQQLQFVPFFFFGYVLMRSKQRFRKLFLIVGVIALANGVVATYQTRLSPAQIASWGAGYKRLVLGEEVNGKHKGGRTYGGAGGGAGSGKVRPTALGSDSGFGGGVGILALPFSLALLAIGGARLRWIAVVLSLGALVAIATSLGRTQVVGGVLAVVAFALLSLTAGRRVTRPLAALLGVVAIAVPLGAVFVSAEGNATFVRYESIAPGGQTVSTTTGYKHGELTAIAHLIAVEPFGVGLGTVGAAGGFGGKNTNLLEGHGVGAENQYKFLTDELGAPGLLFWLALSGEVILLGVRRLRRMRDPELRIYLSAVVAPFIALLLMGFAGPITTSASLGPFFWFAAGVAAYWFAGPGREAESAVPGASG
jgi:hypothetical protein